MSVIEDVEFRILKENWSGHGLFIYRIQPLGQSIALIKRHPKYRSYSIISKKEFVIGQVVTADLEEKPSKHPGAFEYHFVRESLRFPKDAMSQWEFLDRIAGNHSFKRVYNALLEHLPEGTLVLDLLTEQDTPPSFIKEELQEPYHRLKETIERYKKNAAFIEHIPKEVAELLTDASIEKIAELASTAEESAKQFLDQPFRAIAVPGLGFLTLDRIRSQLHAQYPNEFSYAPDNPIRVYYGAYDIIDRDMIKSGDTYITEEDLAKQMINYLKLPKKQVEDFIEVGHRNQPPIQGDKVYKYKDLFTTQAYYQSERVIFDYLSDLKPPKPDPALIQRTQDYLKETEHIFSEEQDAFLHSVQEHKLTILSGGGGTGKTWLVSKLIDIYESVYPRSTVLTAPTGKAAHVLSIYTGKPARTIHSAFNMTIDNNGLQATIPEIEGGEVQLIVFDEASMIDSQLMGNILYAVRNAEMQGAEIRLVFIGDPYQLPSVGPGNILHNLLRYKVANIVTLTKIYRVGDIEGGISQLTNQFRQGQFRFKSQGKPVGVGGDLVLEHSDDDEYIHQRVLTAYQRLLRKDGANPEDIMVLSPQNKGLNGQVMLNNSIQALVREYYNRTDPSYLSKTVFEVEMEFYPDDMVMFLDNATYPIESMPGIHQSSPWGGSLLNLFEDSSGKQEELAVNNGDLGIIDSMTDEGMIVSVIGKDHNVFVSRRELSSITLGYAFTIHKSQGSQAAYGIMAITPRDYYLLNANLLYTGASRFINKLYVFANYRTIHAKVREFINLSRSTLLEEWLKQEEEPHVTF